MNFFFDILFDSFILCFPGTLNLVDELVNFARLGEIVIGSQLDRLQGGIDRSVSGQNQGFREKAEFLDFFQGRDAVHARHLEVKHHHIKILFLQCLDSGIAAVDRGDHISPVGQQLGHILGKHDFIIYQ